MGSGFTSSQNVKRKQKCEVVKPDPIYSCRTELWRALYKKAPMGQFLREQSD